MKKTWKSAKENERLTSENLPYTYTYKYIYKYTCRLKVIGICDLHNMWRRHERSTINTFSLLTSPDTVVVMPKAYCANGTRTTRWTWRGSICQRRHSCWNVCKHFNSSVRSSGVTIVVRRRRTLFFFPSRARLTCWLCGTGPKSNGSCRLTGKGGGGVRVEWSPDDANG